MRQSNRGATRLKTKWRDEDPMRAYDALPEPLRRWMAGAALPWSPASCRHIWTKARAEGASPDDILERLDRAERMTLSRDRLSLSAMCRSFSNDCFSKGLWKSR